MNRVLVVDDEIAIVKGIKMILESNDMEVDSAYDGGEALRMIKDKEYDAVVLDVMLPVLDGFEVCRLVRAFSEVPIIMVTARQEEDDTVTGLDCGADDYMVKPYKGRELAARIKAIIRRKSSSGKNDSKSKERVFTSGDLRIDMDSRKFTINGRPVELTTKEFDLIFFLAENKGKVYLREKLLNVIWGFDFPGDARTVDVHVRRIREKIEADPSNPKYIKTKWGIGYYFE
ncbi:MAG: response regulator transcription factor [Lachnospiraceae bacterium]|nr:response regulator transcription factor [Lachnospiraceae bacterium]